MLVSPIARLESERTSTAKLRLPANLVQLLIGLQGKAEVVSPCVRQRFVGAGDLADDVEIISLCFIVDDAVARECANDVIVDAGRLLARYAGEFHHGVDRALLV